MRQRFKSVRGGRRTFVAAVAALLTLALVPPFVAQVHIAVASLGRVYSPANVPDNDVLMVMGAQARDGRPSRFLQARLDLAVELYRAGKGKVILVTGANVEQSHFETQVMHDYLVNAGIPSEVIVQDPHGYDTYDSCLRARDVFDVTRLTVVTQSYHLGRTLAICKALGIDANGVGDASVLENWPVPYVRGVLREFPAGVKMELDLLRGAKATESVPSDAIQRALEYGA